MFHKCIHYSFKRNATLLPNQIITNALAFKCPISLALHLILLLVLKIETFAALSCLTRLGRSNVLCATSPIVSCRQSIHQLISSSALGCSADGMATAVRSGSAIRTHVLMWASLAGISVSDFCFSLLIFWLCLDCNI